MAALDAAFGKHASCHRNISLSGGLGAVRDGLLGIVVPHAEKGAVRQGCLHVRQCLGRMCASYACVDWGGWRIANRPPSPPSPPLRLVTVERIKY